MSQLLVINHLEPSISHDTISPNHATPSWSDRRAISKVIFAGTALWALAGSTLWARDIFTRGGGSSLPLQPHRITQCWYRGLCYRPSPLGGRGWPWSPPSFIYIIIYVYIYTYSFYWKGGSYRTKVTAAMVSYLFDSLIGSRYISQTTIPQLARTIPTVGDSRLTVVNLALPLCHRLPTCVPKENRSKTPDQRRQSKNTRATKQKRKNTSERTTKKGQIRSIRRKHWNQNRRAKEMKNMREKTPEQRRKTTIKTQSKNTRELTAKHQHQSNTTRKTNTGTKTPD